MDLCPVLERFPRNLWFFKESSKGFLKILIIAASTFFVWIYLIWHTS
jgi:hypothetical protein